ncbi:MAG: sortase [Erysipelotrichaceae bacterium]
MNKLHKKLKPVVLSTFFKVLISVGVLCIGWGLVELRGQTSDYDPNIQASMVKPDIIKRVPVEIDKSALLNQKVSIAAPELYHTFPVVSEVIGTLSFPKLKRTVAIIQGTTRTQLKRGAGHYIQSALPGEIENCVLSGHRETVFRNLGSLIIGDLIIAKTSAGTFTYQVTGTRIVDADDRTVIVPKDVATLTLTTCYPFDTPGYFPQRYIVSAELISSVVSD